MTGELFLFVSEDVALGALVVAIALTLLRLIRGPLLADRILALDMLTTLAVSFVGIVALRTGIAFQLDIALALCLVGFVSTVALTRYLLTQAIRPPATPAGETGAQP